MEQNIDMDTQGLSIREMAANGQRLICATVKVGILNGQMAVVVSSQNGNEGVIDRVNTLAVYNERGQFLMGVSTDDYLVWLVADAFQMNTGITPVSDCRFECDTSNGKLVMDAANLRARAHIEGTCANIYAIEGEFDVAMGGVTMRSQCGYGN